MRGVWWVMDVRIWKRIPHGKPDGKQTERLLDDGGRVLQLLCLRAIFSEGGEGVADCPGEESVVFLAELLEGFWVGG